MARLNERNGFPFLPSQQYLGNLNDIGTTRYYADTTASVLVENGINFNLAPVVDLDINPSNPIIGALGRSFSSDPDVVVNHSFEVIAAHLQRRVFCALKHFPGHGSSAGDSHLGFVDVTNTWSPVELEPFRRIIDWEMRMAIMTHTSSTPISIPTCQRLSPTRLSRVCCAKNYASMALSYPTICKCTPLPTITHSRRQSNWP